MPKLNERINLAESFEQVRSVKLLGDLPLIVLSHGVKDPEMSNERFQRLQALQANLTKLSLNSHHIIAKKSGHLIQLDQPELVVDAVRQLVEKY